MTPLPPPPPLSTAPGPRPRRGRRFAAGSAALIGAGALLALPIGALAQDDGGDGWLDDALQELVDEGTITSPQADAVQEAIADARPERPGRGPGWFGHHPGPGAGILLEDAAEALGIDVTELREALGDGQTIADVAAEQGVEVQAVIDALVEAVEARVDEAIAEGDVDAERAQERLDNLTERITRFVEEGFPGRAGCADKEEHATTDDSETEDSETEDTTVTTPGS